MRSIVSASVPRLWRFVAEAGGSIVGYATYTRDSSTWRAADYLYMDCLFIDPGYRNVGLGTEMMEESAQRAGALGCATLEWQTRAWNANAARFYERLGRTPAASCASVGRHLALTSNKLRHKTIAIHHHTAGSKSARLRLVVGRRLLPQRAQRVPFAG